MKGTVDVIFKEAGICVTVGPWFSKVSVYYNPRGEVKNATTQAALQTHSVGISGLGAGRGTGVGI